MDGQPWWMTSSFDFVKVPKDLFRETMYSTMTPTAKLLYGHLLDRSNLSATNGEAWVDESGNYFVYCTIDEIMERLNCGHDKASSLLKELEDAKLITRTRKSRSKPYRIVVHPFVMSPQNQRSKVRKKQSDDCGKTDVNNTDDIKTDCNYTDSITPKDRAEVAVKIRDNICYEVLLEQIPKQQLDGIVDVIVGAICTQAKEVRIGNDVLPREEVRRRFWELDQMDIHFVRDALRREKNEIRYIHGYIMARLYEAKTLSDVYYTHWAQLDMRNEME